MRTLLALLTLTSAVFGGAGAGTLLLESRLGGLAPGGVTFETLHYDPLTGTVALTGVRALDAGGQLRLTAERVTASAGLGALLGGGLTLRRMHVRSPTLALADDSASALLSLVPMPAALVGARAGGLQGRWAIEGLMITGGSLVVERASRDERPLVIDDIELRLNRLAASPAADGTTAFALDMATYGTMAQVTGSGAPGLGFVVRVRAAGVDVAALLADVAPERGSDLVRALRDGRADLDVDLRVADARVLVSGSVRVGRLLVPGGGGDAAPLHAAGAHLVLDRVDLADLSGRISRLEIVNPSVSLVVSPEGRVAIPPFVEALAAPGPGLVVRRVTVIDGELIVRDQGRSPVVALRGLNAVAQRRERDGAAGVAVTARAVTDSHGRVELTGLLTPARRTLEGQLRLEGIPLPTGEGSGTVGFDGRVTIDASDDVPRLTASGQATVASLRLAATQEGHDALRAESATLALRHFEWPSLRTTFESLVLVRPVWSSAPALPWGRWGEMLGGASVTIVDGSLRAGGEASSSALLFDVNAAAVPAPAGTMHVNVAAGAADGRRLSFSRSYPTAVPLAALLAAVREASLAAAPLRAPAVEIVTP